MSKPTVIVGALILYLAVTGISYAVFVRKDSPPPPAATGTAAVDMQKDGKLLLDIKPEEPKTEVCPLNGQLYTKTEQAAWASRRPLAIMVENSPDARPHSGINRADVVYEAVAEGGVTRFMPVYYCDAQHADVTVAPVRSVRTYFIDWASEYGETPLFGHVGGANCSGEKLPSGSMGPCKTNIKAQAIEQLGKYGWRYAQGNDLDQFSVGAKAYIRNESRLGPDKPVVTEHSVVASTEKLWAVGAQRGWTNLDPKGNDWTTAFRAWKFKEEAPPAERGQVSPVSYDFWSGYKQFDARWEYDPQTNSYKRFTGGEPHLILETGEQITAKNVVVVLTRETTGVDELGHTLYATTGEGDVYVFQDGIVIKGYWKKDKRTGRTIFYTKKGSEITFNPGRIWISVDDKSTVVVYPTPTP
jgi:hypothetical protein